MLAARNRVRISTIVLASAALAAVSSLTACATGGAPAGTVQTNPRMTSRDRTVKGAGIGAGIGALGAILQGKKEADEILAGAAIGAAVGGGVGAYMDAQQEKLAHIPGTTVERIDANTLLVHFDSDILFAVDSASLSSGSRASLDEVGQVVEEYKKTAVVVQGHTDSTGTEEHNQELSERRAKSVANYMVSTGVAGDRVTTLGFGEEAPVASNDSPSGRAQNRRVDVMLRAAAR
jgi:outer membrane protein OmpA-like peptidoglycan-associated protein